MSWSVNAIGTKAAVKAEVRKQTTMPYGIQRAIVDILEEPDSQYDGARVVGHGHTGGGYGCIGKLEVEQFKLAVEPVEEKQPVAETAAGDALVTTAPAAEAAPAVTAAAVQIV